MAGSATLPELPSIDSITLAKLAVSAQEQLRFGKINQSEVLCRAILTYSRHNFNALRIFGMIHELKGQFQPPFDSLSKEAVANLLHKERLQLIRNWLDCGLEFHQKNQFAEAVIIYYMVLAHDQDNAVAIQRLGVYEYQQGHGDTAMKYFDAAIAIKPDYAAAYNNRGNALRDLKRYEEALASYNKAMTLKRDYLDAYNGRGKALYDMKRPEEAIADYKKAVALQPDCAGAHWNASVIYLLLGNYERGWREFEWRWIQKPNGENPRHTSIPLWLGKGDISGKTILLWSEQGLGDTIQFCRFAKHISLLGAKVILEAPQGLVGLLSGIEGVDSIVAVGESLSEVDYQCPLMSLPLALKLSLPDIAGASYLKCSAKKPWVQAMTLAHRSVGIVWRGSAAHLNDKDRSIPLSRFISLLPDGLNAICLQKEICEADQGILSSYTNIQVVSQHLNDFSDTAALIDKLDLVITVDTSIAHLAGAMGKDVWVLLTYVPDWRWLLDRVDSPWYGSATLFRQPKLGDWDSVLMEVNQRLCERYTGKENHHNEKRKEIALDC